MKYTTDSAEEILQLQVVDNPYKAIMEACKSNEQYGSRNYEEYQITKNLFMILGEESTNEILSYNTTKEDGTPQVFCAWWESLCKYFIQVDVFDECYIVEQQPWSGLKKPLSTKRSIGGHLDNIFRYFLQGESGVVYELLRRVFIPSVSISKYINVRTSLEEKKLCKK